MKKLRWPQYVPLALLPVIGACQSAHPVAAWQQRLTDYTMKEGRGDLNILRESAELRSPDAVRPAQIRFDQADIATNGVMVGQHAEETTPVFYFLVGVLDRPAGRRGADLKDIRLVSCASRDGSLQWRTSSPNPDSLHAYLAYGNKRARDERFRSSNTFPRVDDDFRLELRDGVARATETHSGAMWTLPRN